MNSSLIVCLPLGKPDPDQYGNTMLAWSEFNRGFLTIRCLSSSGLTTSPRGIRFPPFQYRLWSSTRLTVCLGLPTENFCIVPVGSLQMLFQKEMFRFLGFLPAMSTWNA